MECDEVIAELAESQHGVFSRRQVSSRGVSDRMITHRLSNGRLESVHPGVYRVRGQASSWYQRIMAGCLAAGPGAVASHRAAAFLHGVTGMEPSVEITVPASRHRHIHGVKVHKARRLDRVDIETRDGIPCTRMARTLVDLAAVVSGPTLEEALDYALVTRRVTIGYLNRRLKALNGRGRRGVAQLTRLIAAREHGRPRAQTRFERTLVALLEQAGLGRPATRFRVRLESGAHAVLDAAYPELRIAIEADSYRYHSTAAAWAHDRTRNSQLTAMGWLVLPVTYQDLLERPEDVIALVRQARRTQLRRTIAA